MVQVEQVSGEQGAEQTEAGGMLREGQAGEGRSA